MANVKIPGDHAAPSKPWDHRAQADEYAGARGSDSHANASYPRPKLDAGGPHNRPARGHETET